LRTRRPVRVTAAALLAAAALTATAAAPATPAGGAGTRRAAVGRWRVLAPGVRSTVFRWTAGSGPVRVHLVAADLTDPRVRVGLLHPDAVAARATVSRLAARAGALAAVNGDFFDIDEAQHPGVPATGAADGPEVAAGRLLTSAVPDGQRFGPALPPGATAADVLASGPGRTLRLDRLTVRGTARTPSGALPVSALNAYALPGDGIGVFTPAWGTASRARAVCGTDRDRSAGCDRDAYRVEVRHGRVAGGGPGAGAGPVPPGGVLLVGRGRGARALRALAPGERVAVRLRAVSADGPGRPRFAVGGLPVLRGGRPWPGLDGTVAATRSAAGVADRGHILLLLALDGSAESGTGLTLRELAGLLAALGASDGVDLDGGGSSTLVTRSALTGRPVVRNHPSGGAQRPVANAVGVFAAGF
jgi:hypothetical protein